VTFSGGFTADLAVVSRLLDLEARGASFAVLPDGRIRVSPPGLMTADERDFLRANREEARRVLSYRADDARFVRS
jgi:hypothetical protein